MPNIPTDKILCLNLDKTFSSVPALYKGLAFETGKDIIIHNPGGNHHLQGGLNNQMNNNLKSSTTSNSRN